MSVGGRRDRVREGDMITETEVRGMQPQAKECEQPPDVGKDTEEILPSVLQMGHSFANTLSPIKPISDL